MDSTSNCTTWSASPRDPQFLCATLWLSLGLLLPAHAAEQKQGSTLHQIHRIVVIYGENRSFDNLYGLFPGARGIEDALAHYIPQTDLDGRELAMLPPVWAKANQVDTNYPETMPNLPFRLDTPPVNNALDVATRDLVHRFYQNQEQINGGRNDRFAAISDAGGLVMGHYDGSPLQLWTLAKQYTLADNFFMGAFGGSFLNHFWLVCACTPVFKNAPDSLRAKEAADGKLLREINSPKSAMDGPVRLEDGAVTPDGYAVNTLQPPYQPSAIPPAKGSDPLLADPTRYPLPPQTQKTIGDTLSVKGITWAWYAGGWIKALADRSLIYNNGPVNFQPHHQPFNYFARFAPGTRERALHLKDGEEFLSAIEGGNLPQVSFYKPQGDLNEHPGYTDVLSGDAHIAGLIRKIQHSPLWKDILIIVTYDENGGFWDHVPPPRGDRWGPGNRIPTLIISRFAKTGFVDHSRYDTTSILKLITRRFDLEPLPGVRDNVGDLSDAIE
ncbi:MAG TPA: acid phosphatase [Burkholderiales bacterium]|nr:acid phosphatase [Burkholderiales bacterium]